MINQDIAKININRSSKTIRYTIKTNGKFEKKNEICCMSYYVDGKLDTLEEYIIKSSYLRPIKEHDTGITRFYVKHLIINDDIIYLELPRYVNTSLVDEPIRFINHKVKIPYILDLPESAFNNDEKYFYELISVILFDDIEKKYSTIIKEGDKYYHYLYDKIIECNNKYFDQKTTGNATGLFYQKL